MVRGASALLIVLAAALVWFLAAPALPEIDHQDTSLLVAGALGCACIAGCTMAIVPLARAPLAFVLVLPGAALLTGALDAAGVGAAATPAEALAYASAGALFAVALGSPALALALPVVVAGIDAASVLGGGPGEFLHQRSVEAGDPLSLELPDVGNGLSAGRLGAVDVVLFAVFAVLAQRVGLRPRATAVAMTGALVGAFAAGVLLDRAIPAIAGMALACFLVNADRIPALSRRVGEG